MKKMWFVYLLHTAAGIKTGCNSATYTEREIDRASETERVQSTDKERDACWNLNI